jgi:hypothetical protein
MPDVLNRTRTLVQRAARVAFAFVVMNSSAVAALGALLLRKKVWR